MMKNPPESPRNFRGERMMEMKNALVLQVISTGKDRDGKNYLELYFNQSLDPKSLNPSFIRINGQNFPSSAKVSYNKECSKIRLSGLDLKKINTIEVKGLKSLSGRTVHEEIAFDVETEGTYRFDRENRRWKKYSL